MRHLYSLLARPRHSSFVCRTTRVHARSPRPRAMWLTELSPWQMLMLAWLVLQIFGFLTRKKEPPGPPGGRVIAIHSEAEYAQEQARAKESGALVRSHRAREVAARRRSTTPNAVPLRSFASTLARRGARRAALLAPSSRRCQRRCDAARCTLHAAASSPPALFAAARAPPPRRSAETRRPQYPDAVFLKVDVDEVRAVSSAAGVRCARRPRWAPTRVSLTAKSCARPSEPCRLSSSSLRARRWRTSRARTIGASRRRC
jgi:hypothetical protein